MQKNEKCGDRTIWFSVDDIITTTFEYELGSFLFEQYSSVSRGKTKLVSISFSKYRLLVRFIHILSQDYTLGYHVLFSIHYNLFINYQPHDSRQLGMSQWQNRHFSLIPKKTLEVIFLYFYCLSVRFIRRPYQDYSRLSCTILQIRIVICLWITSNMAANGFDANLH